MKTLFLVRHASRDDPSLPDREQPLDDRGRHDAPGIGKRRASRKVKPHLIVSSPALRALATVQLIDDRLYASSADSLLAVVHALDNKLDGVMLCGHNPEFTDLAHRLSSEITDMPTCAVAEFRYDTKAWGMSGKSPHRK